MTEKEVIKAWKYKRDIHNPNVLVFPNTFIGAYEADILEITTSGYIHEYEIKLSIPDFRKDILKNYKNITKKHDSIVNGERVNTFSYIVPENMVSTSDVPEYAGLIYIKVYNGSINFKIVKKARRLSTVKIGDNIKEKCLLSTYYRFHSFFKHS